MELKKKGKRSVSAFKDTTLFYVRFRMFVSGNNNGSVMHGMIGIINIHHFICVYTDFFVKSGKDGAVFR